MQSRVVLHSGMALFSFKIQFVLLGTFGLLYLVLKTVKTIAVLYVPIKAIPQSDSTEHARINIAGSSSHR